ncbi:MobF family relaxase [Pseudonocardia nantongensis]|uniref:MobF family relaxase n=1 Tax=Pseudonocardia nantongensis TaxID=1181885 RepID=UPI0039786AE3
MGVVRVTAMAPGSVEYLLHGCDSRPEQAPEQGVDSPAVEADGPGLERSQVHHGGAEYLQSATERGEPDGVWFGSGLEALGLPVQAGDTASAGDVRAIFGQLRYPAHVVPGSTEKSPIYLGSKPRKFRTAAQIVADALKAEPEATAERRFEIETSAKKNTRTPTAYYDVTFSPVKSVSLYYTALLAAGDNEGAETVRAAHEQAVRIALASAEGDVAYVRSGRHEGRGPSGRTVGEWEAATGLAAVIYGHHTNRDGEPQLHSHAGVLNRAVTVDGRVLALDGQAFRPVKDAMATAYTRAYQQLLTEQLGVVFELRADGVAREIAGIDRELMAAASTRTHEKVRPRVAELVEAYTGRHGRAPGSRAKRALVEQAVKDTRRPKSGLAGPVAVAAWAAGERGRAAKLAAALDAVDEQVMAAAATGGHPGTATMTAPDGMTGHTPGREAARLVLAEIDAFHTATAQAVDGHPATARVAAVGEMAVDRGLSTLGSTVDQALVAGVADVQVKYATWTVGNLTAAIDERLGDHAGIGVAAEQRPAFVAALAGAVLDAPGRYGLVQVSAGDPVPVPAALRRIGPGGDGRSMFRAHIDERYATTAAIAGEERLRALTHTKGAVTVDPERIEAAIGGLRSRGLSADQSAVVAGVLGSGRTVDVLVGPAGTGKSHTVGALAGAWRTEMGGRVLGLATAKIAAQNLDGLGLEGMTTAAFGMQFLEQDTRTGQVRQRLQAGDLVVVDEGGMSTTAELIEIADLAAATGAKVLLTGDHHQLQPVGAGGMFAHLAEQPGTFELDTVHRFTNEWEADASLQLRAGDVSAVAAYTDRGRVRTGSLEEMAEHAVRGHLADMLDGKSALLIVDTNQMAAELSTKIHKELVRVGHVAPEVLTRLPDETEIGVGDLIQANNNDSRQRVDPGPDGEHRPVTNKQRYTVIGRDRHGQLLAQDEHGAIAHLTDDYVDEHVTLAYALTNYAAQGVTVDVGRAVTGRDSTRESLYPAITRGRLMNLIYLVTQQAPDEHDQRRIEDTPAQRLADLLTHSEVAEAALTVRDSAEHDLRSFATIGALMNQVSMRAAGDRNDDILAGLLTPEQHERLRNESVYGRMLNKVYAAELDGHDPRALLVEAVGMRSFTDADALSKVLHWRLGQLLEDREPERAEGTAEAGADWTTVADTLAPGEVRDYLHALGDVAQERQQNLGQEIAAQPPQWALDRLPEVPDPVEAPQERADWERRAGLVAAYREYRGIPDHQASLGQAPPPEQPFAYSLWRQATEALDPDPTALAWQQKDTTELYRAREAWALELYRADEYGPRAVGEDLAATRRLAAEIRDDALLTRAEADAPEPTGDRDDLLATAQRHQELAATYTEQADALAQEYEARQQWWEQTAPLREADQAAAVELDRRNLPAWRDTTLPAEQRGEQLELPDTTEPATTPAAAEHTAEPITADQHNDQDQAAAPAPVDTEIAADTGDSTSRAKEAVETLRETARESELKRVRSAPVQAREQQQRAVHGAYSVRAQRDQLDIEAERNIPGQQHHAQHARGLDHGYDIDYGHDDYGYDIDDDY